MACTNNGGLLSLELLFLLLLWSSSIECVSALKRINELPGFNGQLPFSLETGYVEVEEEKGVNLFYYFVESENKPEEDPVLLWLTGGPGCSAITGLMFEIGPLGFDVEGYTDGLPALFYKTQSWTQVSNIIFLDSPIGTGFSYSTKEEGYKSSDSITAHQIMIFLSKWFADHPKFKSNSLYISGDSYSGIIIPLVAYRISFGEISRNVPLNLKGYLAGNPKTDEFDTTGRIPFAHGMGLISDELYESAKQSCGGYYHYIEPSNIQCENYLEAINECTKNLQDSHILEPKCEFHSPHPKDNVPNVPLLISRLPLECRSSGYLLSAFWANNETVREALGINEGTVSTWNRCNSDIQNGGDIYDRDISSVTKYHQNLTTSGYRALIYSGDHDLNIPFTSTTTWIKSLNFSILDDWRPWYVNGQVAGYTLSYFNDLTFATVKGAGHTAPEFKPKECLTMLKRWLSNIPL